MDLLFHKTLLVSLDCEPLAASPSLRGTIFKKKVTAAMQPEAVGRRLSLGNHLRPELLAFTAVSPLLHNEALG